MPDSLEITPRQANELLSTPGKGLLIDVREIEEFALSSLEGALLMPMQSIPAELQKLEGLADKQDLLILCHHGVRSLQVVAWLRARGIGNAFSIAGGIDRWSREVDTDIARY